MKKPPIITAGQALNAQYHLRTAAEHALLAHWANKDSKDFHIRHMVEHLQNALNDLGCEMVHRANVQAAA